MIVMGIGCRRGSTASQILDAVHATAAAAGLHAAKIDALATASFKKDERGLLTAADALNLPLREVSRERLECGDADQVTSSTVVEAHVGVGSVCEAAALSVAGANSRLLMPKQSYPSVTCAIAQGGGP